MAEFTIKFSDILKQLYINNKYTFKEQIDPKMRQELLEITNPIKIVKSIRTKFFNFPYPLYDDSHRAELETKILFHYWDYEIGEETFGKFKFNFSKTMNENMPYYNELYRAVAKQYDFDVNIDFKEIVKGEGKNTATNNTSNSLVSTDIDTQTNEFEERLRKSDTPQNELIDVENGKYISEYNYNNNEGVTFKENNLDSTNVINGVSNGQTNSKTEREIKGTNSRYSKAKMLKEYIEVIQNVDMQVIESLKSCFFLLLE